MSVPADPCSSCGVFERLDAIADVCRDCAVPKGVYHHTGCCVAVCLECGDQRLGCVHGAP